MPRPISITVRYSAALQAITGTAEEPVIMSEGSTFVYLLQNVFMAHPEIEKKYPPGSLGLTVNGLPPQWYSPLFDGDVIDLQAAS